MKIENIQDIKEIFQNISGKSYWIWITAFMRILPALFLWNKFEIICCKDSLDNNIFSKITKITSLQKEWEYLEELNTLSILKSESVKKMFSWEKNINLFLYKNNDAIEKFSRENNYNIIWNPSNIRDKYENKKIFREILQDIWVEVIIWENVDYNFFMWTSYNYFIQKYGENIVIQLPDILIWWWLGTIFINSEKDFSDFKEKIKEKTYKKTIINSLNITKFISGISSSITWCCTKYGTFTTNIQMQIIDIPEVVNISKWNGIFCWHDWSFKKYSYNVNKKAQEVTEKIWNYMYKNGYKWIFGLDLIVDEENEYVYIIECNPRYTGAFPMTSFIDLKNDVIPMDVFHILELLNIDYDIDFDTINSSYKYYKNWSHIIVSNKNKQEILIKKDLLPWVYRFERNDLKYLREWFSYTDLHNNEEFIIIDGNPKTWDKIRGAGELSRFCHILFPCEIMKNPKELNNKTQEIIKNIYKIYT